MEDETIIELFFARDERALRETELKYKPLLLHTAGNILTKPEDQEEVVNDVLLKAWNNIPPERPKMLSAWLRQVARRAAIDVFRQITRIKRGGSEYESSLDEIGEMASDKDSPEEFMDAMALSEMISRWLLKQSKEKRRVFMLRYFDCESIGKIAEISGSSVSRVKVMLLRLREDLAQYLREEGYDL